MQTIALSVAKVRCTDPIASADGSPVWPLLNADDQVALERVARVFGACLEHVPASRSTSRALTDEEVVSLGPDAESAALLYAHLTQRRFRAAHVLDSLTAGDCPSVVVTTPEYLSPELLDWLYDDRGELAPGIICGERGERLLRQVLVRSAAASLCGPLTNVLTEIFPTLSIATTRVPGSEVLGSESTAVERREAVSKNAGVLTIMTHSDGVDAFMGTDLTLCTMDRASDDLPLETAPRCRLTSHCYRHDVAVSQVVGSSAVFAPEEISARVLIWDVCFGVMPTDSVVDPRWGIGTRLLDSTGIGVILTTWQIILSSPEHARGVSRAIASGVPVGVAVGQFNASDVSRALQHRMCLLGDPRLQLPVVSNPRALPASSRRQGTQTESDIDQIRQLALLRLCMVNAKHHSPQSRHSALAARALDAIEAFEAMASKGLSIAELPPQPGNDMRSAVLKYAMSRGKLLENWMPFARSYRRAARRRCPVCERQADTIEAAMRPSGVSTRRLVLCAIDGVLEDAPVTSDIGIELAGRCLRIHGPLPRQRWAGGILLASADPADSVQMMWPAASNGTPSLSVELPQKWPSGPLRLSGIVMWDTSFAVLSRIVRDPNAHGVTGVNADL